MTWAASCCQRSVVSRVTASASAHSSGDQSFAGRRPRPSRSAAPARPAATAAPQPSPMGSAADFQDVLDVGLQQGRVLLQHQRGDARDVRRSHRRAAGDRERRPAALRLVRTDDPRTGSDDVQVLSRQFAAGKSAMWKSATEVVGTSSAFHQLPGCRRRPASIRRSTRRGHGNHRCIGAGVAHAGLACVAGRRDDDHAFADR